MIDTNNPLYYQKISLWKDIPLDLWNDRTWQLKNNIRSLEQLQTILKLSEKEATAIQKCIAHSKFQTTPYYLSLIDPTNPECPIRMQTIPHIAELDTGIGDMEDPLAEDADSPVPGLVHRYPDRALFLIAETCSMYCRFCTRRRHILDKTQSQLTNQHDAAIDYIKQHSEIRDIILSGGDALMLSVSELENIIKRLRDIPHIEIIRVASRMPNVLPMGVTDDYVTMLSKYHPIYFMTHFNHPYEITPASRDACARIANAGMAIQNQSVLLRKINSDPRIIKKLMHNLLKIRVKPYYIYQCDLAEGIEHFRTPVSTGYEIMEYLRGHTSGLALPTFVIDAPGGGGKIPIMPNYILTLTDKSTIMRNYRGMMSSYPNPQHHDCTCSTATTISNTLSPENDSNHAYLDLLEGKRITLTPQK